MVMGGMSMGGMVATLTVMRQQKMWKVPVSHLTHATLHAELSHDGLAPAFRDACAQPRLLNGNRRDAARQYSAMAADGS